MTSLKLSIYYTVSIMLAAHNVFAGETAIIDGRKITVSGNEEAEERFKKYAETRAKERETKVEDELRLRTKMDAVNLGPLKPYITSRFSHDFDWSQFKQYEHFDTEPLFRLLEDPDWVRHWEQTLRVIGAIADKEGAERLMVYILRNDFDSQPHVPSMKAKVTAIAALGRTIRRGVYPEGVEFLKTHINPGAWTNTLKDLNISERHEGTLRRQTIMVLSSIGTSEAVKALEMIREAEMSTVARSVGERKLNSDGKERLEFIDLYIKEAKRGPLEERNYDH